MIKVMELAVVKIDPLTNQIIKTYEVMDLKENIPHTSNYSQ